MLKNEKVKKDEQIKNINKFGEKTKAFEEIELKLKRGIEDINRY